MDPQPTRLLQNTTAAHMAPSCGSGRTSRVTVRCFFQSCQLGLDAEQIIKIQQGVLLRLSTVFSALHNWLKSPRESDCSCHVFAPLVCQRDSWHTKLSGLFRLLALVVSDWHADEDSVEGTENWALDQHLQASLGRMFVKWKLTWIVSIYGLYMCICSLQEDCVLFPVVLSEIVPLCCGDFVTYFVTFDNWLCFDILILQFSGTSKYPLNIYIYIYMGSFEYMIHFLLWDNTFQKFWRWPCLYCI